MPQKKQAPSWRPPSKRTSYQDAKKSQGRGPGFSEDRNGSDERRAPRTESNRSEQPRGDSVKRFGATSEGGRSDRSRNDGARSEGYRSDRSRGEDSRSDSSRSERPRSDSPSFDRSRSERPSSDRPGFDRSRSERPSSDRPGFDRSRSERPSSDRPRSDRPRSDRPDSDRPRSEGSRDYASKNRGPGGYAPRSEGGRPQRSEGGRPRHNDAPRYNDRSSSRSESKGPRANVHHDALQAISVTADSADGVEFRDLGLGEKIVEAIQAQGAERPFALQAATIPVALTGQHVLGRGRTGSGKTIAFSAPLVERLLRMSNKGVKRAVGRAPRALILAPTRELALQIDRTVQPIARSVGLFTTQVYGGVPIGRQIGALERGVDIIIGTPGRIEDLIARRKLDVSQIMISVVDEADHMSELGFIEPLRRILEATSSEGQRMLFSATLDAGVSDIVREFLPNPAVFEVAGEDQASSTIDHRVFVVDQRDKREIVINLARTSGRTLMFTRTRAFAEELADVLDDYGIPAVSLHGDLNQARRQRNLDKLSSGRVNVLVATDVAARGIHVDDIDTVVQVDPPDDFKSYVHRSGRTGRAGKTGTVITLTTRARSRRVQDLLKQAGISAQLEDKKPSDISKLALV
jgi:superfamily II DNA/RNA helicase